MENAWWEEGNGVWEFVYPFHSIDTYIQVITTIMPKF